VKSKPALTKIKIMRIPISSTTPGGMNPAVASEINDASSSQIFITNSTIFIINSFASNEKSTKAGKIVLVVNGPLQEGYCL